MCLLQLGDERQAWQWAIRLKNINKDAGEYDLICMQDVGLKALSDGPVNEYYVSQYLERRILQDEIYGAVICCRQNMKETTGNPWLLLACAEGAATGSTDGMQFYGKTYRETGIPEGLLTEGLSGECAGESSVVALQGRPSVLNPGEISERRFIAIYLPDHPEATSEKDLEILHREKTFMVQDEGVWGREMTSRDALFPLHEMSSHDPFLPAQDLSPDEIFQLFGQNIKHPETDQEQLLSFFTEEGNHVVLRQKELLTDRPHGHIIQARSGLAPDERIMSTTAWMFGVFNAHLTQGNTNFNTLLSICTSPFNQDRQTGQRIFIEADGARYMLGVPSAFEMGLNHCRWIYKFRENIYQVRTWTSQVTAQVNLDFKVLRGQPVNLVITHDFDPLNQWNVAAGASTREFLAIPAPNSMIARKFPKARFRIMVQGEQKGLRVETRGTESLCVIHVTESPSFCMSFVGEVTGPAEAISIDDPDKQWHSDIRVARAEWQDLSLNLELHHPHPDIAAIREILPWYGLNALTHFLTPYGLEQFGGAAWGTRDVAQGPVELLLTLEKYEEARQALCTIFSNQNPDGGWPQWWMFDSYREIRAHEAHGDIFYWCIIALCSYIRVTGDTGILDEALPYYHEDGPEHDEKTPLREHLDRLIRMITGSFIPGTALVPYGGGDWNDSLQPVSRELASRMISSWTVEMCYQAFSEYRQVYLLTGQAEQAAILTEVCQKIQSDFNKHLVRGGVVAGYGLVKDDGRISVMLHPTDRKTGIHYSLLPMERGIISGIFTKEQAQHHLQLIEAHLKGPDGARLMDRPLRYKGGIQEIFQRAESSTFFGREIGLMYVHEHIRYAEALAVSGKAEAFVQALRQAIPVGYRDVVPCGDIRQANCYYSSSDVHFKHRFEADEKYEDVISGKFTLRGGWRVYSSGPGIFIGIIVTRLLGLRIRHENIIIDPVLPAAFDGLEVRLEFMETPVSFRYQMKEGNFSPKKISVNGKAMPFSYEDNPYRQGGAVLESEAFMELLDRGENLVEVWL